MRSKRNIQTTKGAAMVEYMVLMAIIGVSLMTVVLTLGVNVRSAFDDSTTTISERVVPEDPVDPVDPGDPGDPGDPPIVDNPEPPIPPFPPEPPPSGIVYTANADNELSYSADTTLTFAQIAQRGFDDEAVFQSANAPAALFDFENDVTWTGLTYQFGAVELYNEVVFDTTGMTHNVGPLPGWGTSPASYNSCNYMQSLTNDFLYLLEGFHTSGDKVEIYMNFRAASCPFEGTDFNISENRLIRHNQGMIYSFGPFVNALVAERISNGEYAASTGNIDWTEVPSWTLDDLSIPDVNITGNSFNAFQINGNGFSLNAAVAGPAYTVCGESADMMFTVSGVHPSGATMVLNMGIQTNHTDDECFVPFGP
jgi:Flp pilus assembly pilin Flp